VGALVDNAVPTGDMKLSGHTRLDLAASWKIDRIWTASFAADNLLNAQYQEVIGFPAPSTQMRAGLKAAF
jgi:outer membrane cobalamin receptor